MERHFLAVALGCGLGILGMGEDARAASVQTFTGAFAGNSPTATFDLPTFNVALGTLIGIETIVSGRAEESRTVTSRESICRSGPRPGQTPNCRPVIGRTGIVRAVLIVEGPMGELFNDFAINSDQCLSPATPGGRCTVTATAVTEVSGETDLFDVSNLDLSDYVGPQRVPFTFRGGPGDVITNARITVNYIYEPDNIVVSLPAGAPLMVGG